MGGYLCQIVAIKRIAFWTNVGPILMIRIALAIGGPLHQRRVGEEQETVAAHCFGLLHEITLPCTFAPIIVLSVYGLERFHTSLEWLDVTIGLLPSARTRIDSPKRQTDPFRITRRIQLLAKQPFRYLFALRLRPIAPNQRPTPRIRSREMIHSLKYLHRIHLHDSIRCPQALRQPSCRKQNRLYCSLSHRCYL